MDIEVVIKRTLVFAGLVGSVVAVVSLMAFVSQDVLARFVSIPRWVSNVLAAAAIAALYGPLRNWLTNVTDRYLFQKPYDYKEVLKRFTDEVMVGMVELGQLVRTTVAELSGMMRLDNASLLLVNRQSRAYERVGSSQGNGRHISLDENEPFITFLKRTHEPIAANGALGNISFPESVRRTLKELDAGLCLPLSVHEELIGVLCLGNKKSDEPFSQDDLSLLGPLARTLAIAIANAQFVGELRRLNRQLRDATERLIRQERLAAVGQLSAGLAHEIRNPLAAIKTFAEYLPERGHNRVFRATFARVVPGQIKRISSLVDRLLNFARPARPEFRSLSPLPLIEETLSLISAQCLRQHISIERAFQGQDIHIQADPQQLQQVILNLCMNSIEAMPEGGRMRISLLRDNQHALIRIEDTGSGISPDAMQRLFDPFFTTKPSGIGLGMAIVHSIIEHHAGEIRITSKQGKGTQVELRLPCRS